MLTSLDLKRPTPIFIEKRRIKLAASFCGLLLVFVFTAGPGMAADDAQINSTRSSILALDSARRSAVKELENTSLPSPEVSDYRDFVAYLNTQIFNYCRELQELGALTALAGLPCPSGAVAGSPSSDVESAQGEVPPATTMGGSAQTEAEKTAQLQDQFFRALGNFDDMLLKEDQQLANRVPSQRETGLTGRQETSVTTTGRSGETVSGSPAGEEQKSESGEDSMENQSKATGAGERTDDKGGLGTEGNRTRVGAPEGRRPPPEDDDIVARQLWEAAEKEPDPVLKKKLWEEYWKYKGVAPKNG